MLEILINPEHLENEAIRNRAKSRSRAMSTHHYVAKESGNEIGFVAIDANQNVEHLVLYEIFVPPNLRLKGIGTKLLVEVEAMAKELGYKKVTVNPEPFEQDYPKSKLVEWYKSHGYREIASGTKELEKFVNGANT